MIVRFDNYSQIGCAALAALSMGIAMHAGAADAPGKGANADPAKRGSSPRTEGVAQAALADQIARHADRTKDVLAMIAAARLLGQVSPRTVKHEMKTEGAAKPAAAGADASRDNTGAAVARTLRAIPRLPRCSRARSSTPAGATISTG
jgi:hypothetical protein